jgi:glycosyltransferase involved in cell wall biosynthesis
MTLSALTRGWRRLSGRASHRNALLLIVDKAGWILDEIARELQSNLPAAPPCYIVDADWEGARECTIHFINRIWAWTPGVLDTLDHSNRLIGLWWHGRLGTPDPAMRAALSRVSDLHHRFQKIQVTCSIARRTLESLGVPSTKIVTLPEGVNLSVFRPAASEDDRRAIRRELGLPANAFVVGSFQKDGDGMAEGTTPKLIKGPDILVETLSRLRRYGPVVALLPGPARGYVTARLEQEQVPFVAPGFVPRATLPRLHHALDMYLSPSRDEGGPAGVLESMACGVPVVSTRSGMAADLIVDGVSGGLVDVDDIEGLVERAATLMQNRDVRTDWGHRGHELIQPLDWRLLAPQYRRELYGSWSA